MRPTQDSERSPSVYYANWKEEMLLRRQLATLNRTERGLLHRITVTQKVIFRRFQNKLQRSKVSHARMYGDKEREQALRGRSMRKLHSESHRCGPEEGAFLSKLKQTPYDPDAEVNKEKRKRNIPIVEVQPSPKPDVTDKDMARLLVDVVSDKIIPHTPHNLRSLSALGRILDSTHLTDQLSPKKELPERSISDVAQANKECIIEVIPYSEKDTPLSDETARELKQVSNKSTNTNSVIVSINRNRRNPFKVSKITDDDESDVMEKRISGSIGSLTSSSGSSVNGPRSPKASSKNKNAGRFLDPSKRKPSKISSTFKMFEPTPREPLKPPEFPTRKNSSIFEEVEKPDFCRLRLNQAKTVDHTDLVKAFCAGLADLREGTPHFDYYAHKMQADAAQQVRDDLLPEIPGTPLEIYRKYTGDTTIKCITLKGLRRGQGQSGDDDDMHHNLEHKWQDLFDRPPSSTSGTSSLSDSDAVPDA